MPPWCKAILALLVLMMPSAGSSAQETEGPAVPEVSVGEIVWWPDFAPAENVGVQDIWIWLPEGYAKHPQQRFPVLYMHDAENIFDRRLSNFDKEWGVDESITRMARRGDLREWIVVGLRSPTDRYQTLFPQKLLAYLDQPYRDRVLGIDFPGMEAGKPLRGDRYATMLATQLKPAIDEQFRTLIGRDDTAVMGSSMGGLMSLYVLSEYPDVFGQAAGLSTHLPLAGINGGDPAHRAMQVSEAFRQLFAQSDLDPGNNRIYVDHGTATLDAAYPPYFRAFDAMMAELGWDGPAYESRAFFGAEHEENAWAQRIDIPLGFLDREDP